MEAFFDPEFKGVIGKTVEESTPYWPEPVRPKDGSPNVVIILLDDMGFSQLGCYGSDISTPNIDKLAENGIRYNNFHTTAICSPTRASLLTGRNPHATGVAFVTEQDSGFPHSRGKVRKDTGMLSEILVEKGYNTFAVGKWHLAPGAEQTNAGPFDGWPLGRGFERFYGFLPGYTDQWNPDLVEDNHRVNPPKTPEEGYHITEDLTDKAIQFIRDQKSAAPNKPFFCYLAYGAPHAPHQAPKEFIEKYRGKYDKGWDKVREETFARQKELGIIPEHAQLPPRNPGVKAWDELSKDEQRLYARMQEVFAGFMEHTDYHIGRFIDFLKAIDQLDNTLIIFLSDNGACPSGGPEGTVNTWRKVHGIEESLESKLARIDELGSPEANNHYPTGWAQAGNTPFKWYKTFVHAGGVKDPLIIHYPKMIKDKGAIRHQFLHVSDITPTILDLLEIDPPETIKGVKQQPMHGKSFLETFTNPNAPEVKETQYFEMLGNRAIYHKGWKAVAAHNRNGSFDDDKWELYYVAEDYSEMNNLADKYPEKLQELIDLWWQEAEKYGVLPLDGRDMVKKIADMQEMRGKYIKEPDYRVYYPSKTAFHSQVGPNLKDKSFEIRCHINRSSEQEDGVLVAHGDKSNGYSLFIQDNRLVFYYNFFRNAIFTIRSEKELPTGKALIQVKFKKTNDGEGDLYLYVNEQLIGQGQLKHTTHLGFPSGMFHVGQNLQTRICPLYETPFAFKGALEKVEYFAKDTLVDKEAAMTHELATE